MSHALKTVLVVAVLLILLVSVWFFFLYHPKATTLETLKAETQDLLLKLRSLKVKDEQLDNLKKQTEKIKTYIEQKTSKVAHKQDLPEVVESIKKQGRMHGLKFKHIIPDYQALIPIQEDQAEVTQVLKVTLHVQMEGYYKSFGRFVESLSDLPYLVSLGEVAMAYTKELHPRVIINVDTVLYLRSEELKT